MICSHRYSLVMLHDDNNSLTHGKLVQLDLLTKGFKVSLCCPVLTKII